MLTLLPILILVPSLSTSSSLTSSSQSYHLQLSRHPHSNNDFIKSLLRLSSSHLSSSLSSSHPFPIKVCIVMLSFSSFPSPLSSPYRRRFSRHPYVHPILVLFPIPFLSSQPFPFTSTHSYHLRLPSHAYLLYAHPIVIIFILS